MPPVAAAAPIVYVRDDVEEVLTRAQESIEWRLKLNSVVTAAFVYTAFVLTLPPLLYFLAGGGSGKP